MTSLRYCTLAALLLLLSACQSSAPEGPVVLKGAGASFPYPAYAKWITEYVAERSKVVKMEYSPTGSAQGLEDLAAGKIDFAGSDLPLTDEQMAKFPQKPLHFPTLMGAVVPVFHVTGVTDLKLSAAALAGLFGGRIKSWNDPAIAALNPGVNLPALAVKPVHRADGSGSTSLLTSYLAAQDQTWNDKIGHGMTVKWPAGGAEATGSAAMAAEVAKTPGAIGYVEFNYANKEKLNQASVQNRAGKYVRATFESVAAAVDQNALGEDFRNVAVNAAGEKAYPIAALTYLIVPRTYGEGSPKGKAMRFFLEWLYTLDAQKVVNSLDYDLLDGEVLRKIGAQSMYIK